MGRTYYQGSKTDNGESLVRALIIIGLGILCIGCLYSGYQKGYTEAREQPSDLTLEEQRAVPVWSHEVAQIHQDLKSGCLHLSSRSDDVPDEDPVYLACLPLLDAIDSVSH